MPVYEYQCQACGLRFERRQHYNDAAITDCPDCSGTVIRLIQPAGIIFKGSGFYVTDSRSKSPTAIPGNRKKEEAKEDTKETSTENSGTSTTPKTDAAPSKESSTGQK